MEWSKNPELFLNPGDQAIYVGVLVPEVNYRNYKAMEKKMVEYQKFVDKSASVVDNPTSVLTSPVFWGIVGVLAGGLTAEMIRK